MNLFPTAIVSWTEPAAYSYASRKRFTFTQFFFFLIGACFLFRTPHFPTWGILVSFFVATLVVVLPWLHARWPTFFPLTGARVTLYDDRFTRRYGRSGGNVMFSNIKACSYQNYRDDKGQDDYWLLRFDVKTRAFGMMNIVTETAIPDSQTFEQVILALREKGIPVNQLPIEAS